MHACIMPSFFFIFSNRKNEKLRDENWRIKEKYLRFGDAEVKK
jgi:hypothetical protein